MAKKCFRGKRGHRGHKKFHGCERVGYSKEELAQIMHFFAEAAEKEQNNIPESSTEAGTNSETPETGRESMEEPIPNSDVSEPSEYLQWPLKLKKLKKFAKHEEKWKCKEAKRKFKGKHGRLLEVMNMMARAAEREKEIAASDAGDNAESQENEMLLGASDPREDGMQNTDSAGLEPLTKKFKKFAKHGKKLRWKYYDKGELKQIMKILGKVTEKEKGAVVPNETYNDTGVNSSEIGEPQDEQMQDGQTDEPREPSASEVDEARDPSACEVDEPRELSANEANKPEEPSAELLSELSEYSRWLSRCKKMKKFAKHEKKWKSKEAKRLQKGHKKFKNGKKMDNDDSCLFFKKRKNMNEDSGKWKAK